MILNCFSLLGDLHSDHVQNMNKLEQAVNDAIAASYPADDEAEVAAFGRATERSIEILSVKLEHAHNAGISPDVLSLARERIKVLETESEIAQQIISIERESPITTQKQVTAPETSACTEVKVQYSKFVNTLTFSFHKAKDMEASPILLTSAKKTIERSHSEFWLSTTSKKLKVSKL